MSSEILKELRFSEEDAADRRLQGIGLNMFGNERRLDLFQEKRKLLHFD